MDDHQPLPERLLNDLRATARSARGALARTAEMRTVLHVVLIVFAYVILDRLIRVLGALPATAYYRPLIFPDIVVQTTDLVTRHAFVAGLILLGSAVLAVAAPARIAVAAKRLMRGWGTDDLDRRVRVFVGTMAVLLAWIFSTYGYNYYFDQAHYVDRVLVVVLASLVWWRPVFVLPFLLELTAIIGQLAVPLGGYSWATQSVLICLITLFFASAVVESIVGRSLRHEFLFVGVCSVATHYFVCGVAKLELGWFSDDRVHLLLTNAYAHGWLAGLSDVTISQLAKTLSWADLPMRLYTGAVEVGAILILVGRRSARWLIPAWILLHAGIFLVSGIFFWKWVVAEALFYFLFLRRGVSELPIYTTTHRVLSVVLIAAGAFLFRPTTLAWLDSAITYVYRFEGIGTSGEVYELPPHAFEPYWYQFSLSGFGYLSQEPRLSVVMGATRNRYAVERLFRASTRAEIEKVEQELGHGAFDRVKAARMDTFLTRYVSTSNRPGRPLRWIAWLSPPRDLMMHEKRSAYEGQEPLERIRITEVTTHFDGQTYREVRRQSLSPMQMSDGE